MTVADPPADDPRFEDYEPEPPHGFDFQNVILLNGKGKLSTLEGPTVGDPLRGLQHLPLVALVGRERMLQLARTPVEYLWQDIAVAGTVVLIAGPPSEGKTTLLFLVLACRLSSSPTKLLERQILPGPADRYVVLIEGEHSEASTMRKMVKSLKLMQVDDIGLDRLIVIARKSVIVGSSEWCEIETMIAAGLVSDIGIDTLARVAPAEANDESQQVAIFNRLAGAIERAPSGADRPTIWAVAHTRKGSAEKQTGLAEVSGSVQRVGQSDTVLLVRGEKVEGQTVSSRVTFEKLREDPDEYPKPFEFAIIKGLDGEPMFRNAPPKRDDRPLEVRVLEWLREAPQTKRAIRDKFGRSDSDVETVITNLFDARSITTVKSTVAGRKRTQFSAREELQPEHGTGARDSVEHGTSMGLPWDEL